MSLNELKIIIFNLQIKNNKSIIFLIRTILLLVK